MKTGANEALLLTFAMGAVILFCRAFPFLFFRGPKNQDKITAKSNKEKKEGGKEISKGSQTAFLNFVERTVPPAAMTVLAFNSMAAPVKGNIREAVPVLAAAALTALVHLWKRNPLISIFGGTALYMVLERVIAG